MRVDLIDDVPVRRPTRELPYQHIDAADAIIQDYLRRGIIERSVSTYKPMVSCKESERKVSPVCRLH